MTLTAAVSLKCLVATSPAASSTSSSAASSAAAAASSSALRSASTASNCAVTFSDPPGIEYILFSSQLASPILIIFRVEVG
eukprot:CAMPEP_0179494004 /NCGR_PEP_ID=MMETSP0799-20121207/67875_1 /TAXON_ID=46947 /ORGANISM="Geminigera cryophila, Strain CCMP2564" /LENGTH=80 /DNA_ID=CAMNT_0021311463 /DNA_START=77 /DNA_END=316 /DNA_ORIENTATION=+